MAVTRVKPVEGRYGTIWWVGAVVPGGGTAMTAAQLAKCSVSDDTWYTTDGAFNPPAPSAYPYHIFRFNLSEFDIDDIITVLYYHEEHTVILTGLGGPKTTTRAWGLVYLQWWAGWDHYNAVDTVIGGSCGGLPIQYIDGSGDLWIRASSDRTLGAGPGTLRLYTDCVWLDVYHGSRNIAMPETNPVQVLSVGSTVDVHLDITDWQADGASTNWEAHVAGLLDDKILSDVSVAQWGGDVLAAILTATQGNPVGTPYIGVLRLDEWRDLGAIPMIGSGFLYVDIDVMPSGSMVVALLLYDDSGTFRWYQTCGLWDAGATAFAWQSPPVECETAAVDFPDAANSKGSLRHTDDGGLLFAFLDSADDTRLFRCASMPSDATGIWEAV